MSNTKNKKMKKTLAAGFNVINNMVDKPEFKVKDLMRILEGLDEDSDVEFGVIKNNGGAYVAKKSNMDFALSGDESNYKTVIFSREDQSDLDAIIGKLCYFKFDDEESFTDKNMIECKVTGFNVYLEDKFPYSLSIYALIEPLKVTKAFEKYCNGSLKDEIDCMSTNGVHLDLLIFDNSN